MRGALWLEQTTIEGGGVPYRGVEQHIKGLSTIRRLSGEP